MIVKITLEDGNDEGFTMYFGDSYEKWSNQFQDYCWKGANSSNDHYIANLRFVNAAYCIEKFPSYGGLKWSDEKGLIKRLNEEAAYLNKVPVDFTAFKWIKASKRMVATISECLQAGKELAAKNFCFIKKAGFR